MSPKAWTVRSLLTVTADYLKEKQIQSPRLTAEVLLSHQLDMDRVKLYLNLDQPLHESEISGYRRLIRRRVGREPLQYITGVQEFWSMDFMVDSRVLIPRPETELLVEEGVKRLQHEPVIETGPRILDLGTGSGILAVALAKEIPRARIQATDISAGAVSVARLNAEKHGVLNQIEFKQGDLWLPVKSSGDFDLIVSNPPYVSVREYETLPPEVRDYEPRVALDGGDRGMQPIRRIIKGAPAFLRPGGWLLLEMSPPQTEPALELAASTGAFGETGRIKDYGGCYRVIRLRLKGTP